MVLEIEAAVCGKVAPANTKFLVDNIDNIICNYPEGHSGYCRGRFGVWDVYWNSKTVLGAYASNKPTR